MGIGAALGLAFLTLAPNRLVLGTGIPVAEVLHGWRRAILLPALLLCFGVFTPPARRTQAAVALAASLLLVALIWLAGDEATRLAEVTSSISRISLGGGFWVLLAVTWLAAVDALQRLGLSAAWRTVAGAAVIAPVMVVVALGELNQLSLLKEYANRQDVFHAAFLRHLQIVGVTLVPTLVIGVPLGLALFRSERLAPAAFAVLNVIQTVPSIALFGLLIAPLALLAATLPWLGQLGISGIGLAPAIIALTLYSLLPIVRSTVAGLGQVPQPVIEAAAGMGLTPRQIFWKVQAPIALPLLLSGIRVTTVQAIGLTVVAALIGAGGLGSIMFQGLLSSALDLVLLGVVPVVALAVTVDAVFRFVTLMLDRSQR
ncbi:MAG: ABC transporter permease [Casimicrobiaceae bacterium]